MSKENEKIEPSKPISFIKGEEVFFVPTNGPKEEATIQELPTEGRSKYLVKLASGSVLPINACYLAKR